jgi:hypothetical protein
VRTECSLSLACSCTLLLKVAGQCKLSHFDGRGHDLHSTRQSRHKTQVRAAVSRSGTHTPVSGGSEASQEGCRCFSVTLCGARNWKTRYLWGCSLCRPPESCGTSAPGAWPHRLTLRGPFSLAMHLMGDSTCLRSSHS